MSNSLNAGISLLDEAFQKRLDGDLAGSLRRAIALVETDPNDLWAATLLAVVLVDAQKPFVSGEALMRAARGFIRRGDLPAAVWVSRHADKADEDGDTVRNEVATAFGKESARLSDVTPAPPPLPADVKVPKIFDKLGDKELMLRAEAALEKFMATDDAVQEGASVPELPLFGALPPAQLAKLLSVTQAHDYGAGARLIQQGDEGERAFIVVRGMLRVEISRGGNTVTLAALGPGSILGEMALVSQAPRAASVVAIESSMVLCIARDDLEALAADEPIIGQQLGQFCRVRMLANLVRHSPVLSRLDPAESEEVVGKFRMETFEDGEVLVEKGEDTAGLFLIASGAVEVIGEDSDGDKVRVATLSAGDVVGEISLVLRRPAGARVVALHPTVVLHLDPKSFQATIREHPQLLTELYEIATEREEETRTVVAQEAVDVDDVVLL